MATVTVNNWDLMPPEIFDEIMFLLGRKDPSSLDVYRRVCRDWNEKIMNSLKVHPTTKWGDIISRRFEKSWEVNLPSEEKISKALELETDGIIPVSVMQNLAHRVKDKLKGWSGRARARPFLEEITCAAILAHKGTLVPEEFTLENVNLASIPAQYLASLVSSVTDDVHIIGEVSGCSLMTILDSAKCRSLHIDSQILGTEETDALVQAMETCVKVLHLYDDVTLDMETFNKYSGRGKCSKVTSSDDRGLLPAELRERLLSLTSKGWQVTYEYPRFIMIERNQ